MVFKATEGRLGGKVRITLGSTPHHGFKRGIPPQIVGVVLIFIAQGDLVNPLAEKVDQGVVDFSGLSSVGKNGGRHLRDPVAQVDFLEQKSAGVGGDIATLEIGENVQIKYPSKIELLMTHC